MKSATITKSSTMTYVSHNELLSICGNIDKYSSSDNDLHSSILEYIQLKCERYKDVSIKAKNV